MLLSSKVLLIKLFVYIQLHIHEYDTMAAPSNPYPISGIPTGIHTRRNIENWHSEVSNTISILEKIDDPGKKAEESARLADLNMQWNLFLEALVKLQSYPETTDYPLGWYQISGKSTINPHPTFRSKLLQESMAAHTFSGWKSRSPATDQAIIARTQRKSAALARGIN